jgi:hypothetical protein
MQHQLCFLLQLRASLSYARCGLFLQQVWQYSVDNIREDRGIWRVVEVHLLVWKRDLYPLIFAGVVAAFCA